MPLEFDGDEKWILLVSVASDGPNGGSGTQYFVGEFDGSSFSDENPGKEAMWLEYGRDNYAGVTFSDMAEDDGRRILIGWMSNWDYAQVVPTERWRNAMTIPRELYLVLNANHYEVLCKPIGELDGLRKDSFEIEPAVISGKMDLRDGEKYESSMYEINLEFNIPGGTQNGIASEFGFMLSNSLDEQLTVGYSTSDELVYIDRTISGKDEFSEQFPGIHKAPLSLSTTESIVMNAYIDKASIELFINDGQRVMTEIFFPSEDYDKISLFAHNGSVILESGIVYSLKSIR
jgi:fructan beta-fructosidase